MIDATKPPSDALVARVQAWLQANGALPTGAHEAMRIDVCAEGMTAVVLVTVRTSYTPRETGVEPVQQIERQVVWDATASEWSLPARNVVRAWARTLIDMATTSIALASGESDAD